MYTLHHQRYKFSIIIIIIIIIMIYCNVNMILVLCYKCSQQRNIYIFWRMSCRCCFS